MNAVGWDKQGEPVTIDPTQIFRVQQSTLVIKASYAHPFRLRRSDVPAMPAVFRLEANTQKIDQNFAEAVPQATDTIVQASAISVADRKIANSRRLQASTESHF